jgi:hypothetical protein
MMILLYVIVYIITVILSYVATRHALIRTDEEPTLFFTILIFIPIFNILIFFMEGIEMLNKTEGEKMNKFFRLK